MTDETASLIQLLDEYKGLRELLRKEQVIILNGEMEELGPLLNEGSDRMRSIEERVKALRKGDRGASGEEELRGRRKEIGLMLKELLHLSRQNEELIGGARRKVGEEIEKIKTGQKLLRTYRYGGLG